jgi:hypothetical protein
MTGVLAQTQRNFARQGGRLAFFMAKKHTDIEYFQKTNL